MEAIKSFIYLDEYKMYSIGSQILEGMSESVTTHQVSEIQKGEEQKGPIRSGNTLSDVLRVGHITQEQKSLHDYAYTVFEERLRESSEIVSLSANNIDENITQINVSSFVEIRGKVAIIDMNSLRDTIVNFNEISNALINVVNYSSIAPIKQQMEEKIKATKDRNEKARLKQMMKTLINEVSAKNPAANLLGEDYIKDLETVLKYGFRDQFAIRITIGPYIFWVECDTGNLREKKDLLIRRFSRFPEPEFVIVGTISQSLNQTDNVVNDYATSQCGESLPMKTAIMNLIEHLSAVDSSFTGRSENEIIVDPIAIYTELSAVK